MKAIKYKVKIHGGALEFAHGFGYEITEVFIPEKKIGFNIEGDGNIFKLDEPRSKNGIEIDLSDELVDKINKIYTLQLEIKVELVYLCDLGKDIFKQEDL